MAGRMKPLRHARYLCWARKARQGANAAARMRGEGDVLDRHGMSLHLFRWAIDEGRIDEPDTLDRPHSAFVAEVFASDPEAVKAEARRYWRQIIEARQHDRS